MKNKGIRILFTDSIVRNKCKNYLKKLIDK